MTEYVICGASLPTICSGEDPPAAIAEQVNQAFVNQIEEGYKVLPRFQYHEGDGDEPIDHYDDGTYEEPPFPILHTAEYHVQGAIICMACYCSLMPLTPSGRALLHEISAAIDQARRMDPADLPRVG